jgi:DNA polymerase-3 subunit epsilon
MKLDLRELAAALAPGLLLALIAVLGGLGFAATLEAAERAALGAMLEPRAALLLLGWLLLALALGALARQAYLRWVRAPARLAEEAAALLHGGVPRELGGAVDAAQRALAATISAFAAERAALREDVAHQVAEGARSVEQERSRLAALMAELTQSVVVCNLDGRILLYNNRARFQFRALSAAPLAGGAELVGLGRSIYAVFDRQLVAHALERIQQRLQRGAAHPSAQFVTGTRTGQLLRVQMAPVRSIDGADEAPLSGFVLMLANITRDFAQESAREAQWHALIEASRAALGNLQAAVEMLDYPDVDPASRERFHGVIRDEVQRMSTRVQEAATRSAEALKSRWPLEDMLGADLVAAARARIEALRRSETFEQFVDPQCAIPEASIAIHAITPEMVAGQPVLAEVLPAFHAFAADTVLVAHNAAFDMRFLQRAEAETGVVFDQPVLDTLLLSALVHPHAESHGLEAIAERLGVPVLGRHTALGDAIVTAEVFLKLVPLLAALGIHTLGQAQAAAQKTWYARVSY